MLSGEIRELEPRFSNPVDYHLSLSTGIFPIQEWIGRVVQVQFNGTRRCVACGRVVPKLFQNGYCFPCVRSRADCDLCIVKPHECHFHLGTCRDETFAEQHCMVPHHVYLAFSSGFKVGLTRKGRQVRRWMDQGATLGIVIAETPTRKEAGELEVAIGQFIADKTDWRKMLREEVKPDREIQEIYDSIIPGVLEQYEPYLLRRLEEPLEITYPRQDNFSVNVRSVNLDKSPVFTGLLRGIKGQYLLFDEGVLNIKKHAGFELEFVVL